MTDKVQKIKKEIEKRIESMNSSPFRNAEFGSEKFDEGELYAYKQILQFIDSLSEEPANEDKINECPYWDKDWGCNTSPMNRCDICPHAKWVEVKDEKCVSPASKNLKEAASLYCYNLKNTYNGLYGYHITDAFEAGAEWQRKKDLKEFIEKTCKWLRYNTMRELLLDYESTELVKDFCEDFKNYMQNE